MTAPTDHARDHADFACDGEPLFLSPDWITSEPDELRPIGWMGLAAAIVLTIASATLVAWPVIIVMHHFGLLS